jgi:uncharacterized delta-60 repeat protein
MKRFFRVIRGAANLCVALLGLGSGAASVAAPGDIDPTWAPAPPPFQALSGYAIVDIGGRNDYAKAIAVQPDGKVVVVGTCQGFASLDYCAVRFDSAGAVDTTFAANGKFSFDFVGQDDEAVAVTLAADGKILIAGTCRSSTAIAQLCVLRLTTSGQLDSTFNTIGGGYVSSSVGSEARASAVVVSPDGAVTVSGSCRIGAEFQFCLVRLNSGGFPDFSFGNFSVVTTDFDLGNERGTAMALQHDGKIVLAGTCDNGAVIDYCVARYTPTGALDTTFNATGRARQPVAPLAGSPSNVVSVFVRPDQKILLVGACQEGNNPSMCALQRTETGAPDSDYAGRPSGLWVANTTTQFEPSSYGPNDVAASAMLPDGRLLFLRKNSNNVPNAAWSTYAFDAWGYFRAGNRAPGGTSGFLAYPAADNVANALALQPDGKILIAGACRSNTTTGLYDFCVARYEGGPFAYQQCSLDLDGDGRVLATTDVLINARVALGMTGAAVLNGINFPQSATRTDWASIRKFLITQCGMTIQ